MSSSIYTFDKHKYRGVTMGAMKNIAIDMMDLQHAAVTAADEESFMKTVMEQGWISPTEQEGRRHQASKLMDGLTDGERIAVKRVLDAVGVDIPAVDFPIKTLSSATK
jgi:hypothetical protein